MDRRANALNIYVMGTRDNLRKNPHQGDLFIALCHFAVGARLALLDPELARAMVTQLETELASVEAKHGISTTPETVEISIRGVVAAIIGNREDA